MSHSVRHLVIVLGDQLDEDSSALTDFDPQQDAVWMAEVDEESTHVDAVEESEPADPRAKGRDCCQSPAASGHFNLRS